MVVSPCALAVLCGVLDELMQSRGKWLDGKSRKVAEAPNIIALYGGYNVPHIADAKHALRGVAAMYAWRGFRSWQRCDLI